MRVWTMWAQPYLLCVRSPLLFNLPSHPQQPWFVHAKSITCPKARVFSNHLIEYCAPSKCRMYDAETDLYPFDRVHIYLCWLPAKSSNYNYCRLLAMLRRVSRASRLIGAYINWTQRSRFGAHAAGALWVARAAFLMRAVPCKCQPRLRSCVCVWCVAARANTQHKTRACLSAARSRLMPIKCIIKLARRARGYVCDAHLWTILIGNTEMRLRGGAIWYIYIFLFIEYIFRRSYQDN